MVITSVMVVRSRDTADIVVVSLAFEWLMWTGDVLCGTIHNMSYLERNMMGILRIFKLFKIP